MTKLDVGGRGKCCESVVKGNAGRGTGQKTARGGREYGSKGKKEECSGYTSVG